MNVYILKDPNDLIVRYVGLTSRNVEHRLQTHIKEARGKQRKGQYLNEKHKWILGLLAKGQRPYCMSVLENIDKNVGILVEKNLIAICKRECDGGTLKNIQQGGSYSDKINPWNRGLKGCYTDELIESMKMSQVNRKEVYRFDKQSNFIDRWISIRTMCSKLGLNRRAVQKCLFKRTSFISHKGFMFSYSREDVPIYQTTISLTTKSKLNGK